MAQRERVVTNVEVAFSSHRLSRLRRLHRKFDRKCGLSPNTLCFHDVGMGGSLFGLIPTKSTDKLNLAAIDDGLLEYESG